MLIDINKIKVEKRIRKAYGDIEGLATSIKELGLLNPPVVTPDFELVAGERRLKALKHLKYQQIEVNIMTFSDYETKFRAEIEENEQRLEFTFSERMEWARELEQIERGKSLERKKNTQFGSSVDMENFPQPSQGSTRDIVAEQTGFGSGKQYEKAKFVVENADPELIKQLDEEQISVHAAYQRLKKEKEDLEKENLVLKSTSIQNDDMEDDDSNADSEKIKELEDDLKKEIADKESFRKKSIDTEAKKTELELKLKEIEDYEKSEKAEINNLKKQKEKLELQAHISISTLQIGIHKFIEDYSPSVFLQGAVASSGSLIKEDILDSVVALEEFVEKLRSILNAKITKKYIDVEVV